MIYYGSGIVSQGWWVAVTSGYLGIGVATVCLSMVNVCSIKNYGTEKEARQYYKRS